MPRRPGITLMEVLVAIFIMGIGMLAMLVLFPLGVLRMTQAIQSEYSAQASQQSTAIGNIHGVRNDSSVLFDPGAPALEVIIINPGSGYAAAPAVTFSPPQLPGIPATGTAVVAAGLVTGVIITNHGSGYTDSSPITVTFTGASTTPATAIVTLLDSFTNPGWTLPLLRADPNGPSYPIFVDPMGYCSVKGLANQYWVAGISGGPTTIARRSTNFAMQGGIPAKLGGISDPALTLRWTCLLDSIPFTGDSTPQYDLPPVPPVPGTYTRDVRYCWSYLLKRPQTSDPSVVDMSVVVYNNRPILSSVFNEYLYQTSNLAAGLSEVTFQPPNMITIDVSTSGNVVPPAVAGNWLLDASYVPSQVGPFGTANGYFYRIVGVTQNSPTSFTYELQQPLRNMPATMAINAVTNLPYAWQKIIFLEGVAEVFEKGTGRLP